MGLGERPARSHEPTAQGRGHWGGERPAPLWEPRGRSPHPVTTLSFRRSTATPLIRVFPPALGPRGPSTFLPNCTMCRYVWGRRQLWARPRPPRGSGRAVGAPCRLTHTDPRRLVACVVKPLAADEQTGLATGSGRQREGVCKGRRPCGGGGRGAVLWGGRWPGARCLVSWVNGARLVAPRHSPGRRCGPRQRGPDEASAVRRELAVRRAAPGSGDARALSPAPPPPRPPRSPPLVLALGMRCAAQGHLRPAAPQ